MNDDELRNILLGIDPSELGRRVRYPPVVVPGSRILIVLRCAEVLIWAIAITALIFAIGFLQVCLFEEARGLHRAAANANQGAIQLALCAVVMCFAACLTFARSLMARVVKLRKVNAAWLEYFRQTQAEQLKARAE